MNLWFKLTAGGGIVENTPQPPVRIEFAHRKIPVCILNDDMTTRGARVDYNPPFQSQVPVLSMRYWLMKSEPDEFSIDDLKASPKQTDMWDGIRNYQARNMIRDDIKKGDQVFFYHSNCAEPGIVGVMEVVKEAYPDPTAFDADDDHFDPKSDPDDPRWFAVDLKFRRKFKRTITLSELKSQDELSDMRLLQRGNRLSVMPISKAEWDFITGLE